jgi:DNA polymerase-3 subunit epsilon
MYDAQGTQHLRGAYVEFVAIDFETANPDLASICQVGVVRFRDGGVVDSWESLVNPKDYFDDMNQFVHGIDESMVRNAPTWGAIHETLERWMKGAIVVCHTSFDRVAFHRACGKHEIEGHACAWLDSSRVVRRAWPEFAHSGYGLKSVSRHLGIEFRHHDAKEDARAAGEILCRAIEQSGLSLDEWLVRSRRPLTDDAGRKKTPGDPSGPLFGETLVFTGSLDVPRAHASELAAKVGCNVDPGVTKRTTILVVGDQDIQKLNGNDKSLKHRKAEDLMLSGQAIRILAESDFVSLVGMNT